MGKLSPLLYATCVIPKHVKVNALVGNLSIDMPQKKRL